MMNGFGIFFLTLGLLSFVAQPLRFELQSGHTKCISEDIKSNAMTVGKYSVVNSNEGHPLPDSHKITLRVTSSTGNNYHFGDLVQSGQFAFTAHESGDYLACFSVLDHKPTVTVTIDFDWRTGVAARDWSNVAKKGQLDAMEVELKKLFDSVTSIHEEMFYLRDRKMMFVPSVLGTMMAGSCGCPAYTTGHCWIGSWPCFAECLVGGRNAGTE